MATTDQTGATLAILIDADNANPAIVKGLIDEVAKFGRATVRRITRPTAWPRRSMKSGVTGACPTVPRMPSVPK